tara:strand:+ start:1169 stop:1513 length:345 start_codon:yes stop_codon:yes gene_type:complete
MSSTIKEIFRNISLDNPQFTVGDLSLMMGRCSSYISHCDSLNRPVSDSALINLWKSLHKEHIKFNGHLIEAASPIKRTATAFQIQGLNEKIELYSELAELVLKHLTERVSERVS